MNAVIKIHSPIYTAVKAFLVAAVVTISYESLKQWYFGDSLSLWMSHIITVLWTSIIAALVAYFAIKYVASSANQLLENEARYHLFFDNAIDGIFILSEKGEFIDCNNKGASMYGFRKEEIVSRTPLHFSPERQPNGQLSIDVAAKKVSAAFGGYSQQFEWKSLRAGHIPFNVEITLNSVRLSGATCLMAIVRDITERKRIEQQLKENELQYRTLADSGQALIWTAGTDKLCNYFNKVWLEFTGRSMEQEIGNGWTEGVHPDDLPGCLDIYVSSFESRKSFGMDYRLRRHDGEYRWIRDEGCPRYNSDGEFIGYIGYCLDITDRKIAEEALRESEEKLRGLFELSPLGIALTDMNGRYVEFNEAFQTICGYPTDELKKLDYWALTPKEYEKNEAEQLQSLSKNGSYGPYVKEYRQKDGRRIPIQLNGTLITGKDGKKYIWSIVENITARKQAEESLKITASVFNNSQEAILISDVENNIVDVNPAFTRITGYGREEVLGRNPRLLSSGHQDSEFYFSMWKELTNTGGWRGEIWNRRKTGEIYAEQLSISAIKDGVGKVLRYVAVFSDISHIKEHEAELSRVAYYDALTGIPNRVLLADRMKQAIAQTAREQNMMAVCYLDLDGFKPINDKLGHEAGDHVLIEVAKRIGATIRGGDTVARIGGDEFVVLLLGLNGENECFATLERLLEVIAQPIYFKEESIMLGASIGVSMYPINGADSDSLLRTADQAMYAAKQSGKNKFNFSNLVSTIQDFT